MDRADRGGPRLVGPKDDGRGLAAAHLERDPGAVGGRRGPPSPSIPKISSGTRSPDRVATGRGADHRWAPPQIAVDGKVRRRSFDRRRGRTPLHLVSAFATRSGLVLAQRRVANKGGEPAVLGDLLAGLDLRGTLVSLDAASCHPSVAEAITGRGGDDPIALKGSRRGLRAAVQGWFGARAFTGGGGPWPCAGAWGTISTAGPSRRRVFVADAEALPGAAALVAAWPGRRRVIAVEAVRSLGNPPPNARRGASCQIRYDLTSPAAPEARIAAAVRAHRGIENRLHRVLDTGRR